MIRFESIINKRMETCKACPIYNHTFNSCGKPIVQKLLNVFNDPIELDGVVFQPCGCHMPTKSRFTLFDCPAGRWEQVVDKSLKQDLIELTRMLRGKTTATLDDRRNLQALYNEAMQSKIDITTVGCSQCVRNILDSVEQELKDLPKVLEATAPTPSESEDAEALKDLIAQKENLDATGVKPKRKPIKPKQEK